jgi:HEPN domain-containing protein
VAYRRFMEDKKITWARMTVGQLLRQADIELQRAREALEVSMNGRARTAARRAAGNALTALKQRFPERNYGDDAIRQLRNLMDDVTVPLDVREAAERLQARITEQFTPAFSADPVEEAMTILKYVKKCLEEHE